MEKRFNDFKSFLAPAMPFVFDRILSLVGRNFLVSFI
jgi:hypothetical protein